MQAIGTPVHLRRVKVKGQYVAQLEVFKRPPKGIKSLQEDQALWHRQKEQELDKN